MYLKKEILEAVSGFTAFSNNYWSSTEVDFQFAREQLFDTGTQSYFYKGVPNDVRAVRAF